MKKQITFSSTDENNNPDFDSHDDYSLDDDDFFERYEKNNHKNKGSKYARRLIEKMEEEKALKESLDEYYYHVDD